MMSPKRIWNESDDDMSTVSLSDGLESEEEMPSPEKMRNGNDEKTLRVSNVDIFSSLELEDGKSSKDIDASL